MEPLQEKETKIITQLEEENKNMTQEQGKFAPILQEEVTAQAL
jgi:hypothetical protein